MTDEAPKPKTVRIFTSIVKIDAAGQPHKQFFDMPLLDPGRVPPVMTPQGWQPQTPWMFFMGNFLQHRGVLVENAWIPERMVELIIVEPDVNALDPSSIDMSNVVKLR